MIITIKSQLQKDNTVSCIQALSDEKVWEVVISEKKKNRSLAQNRLLRLWQALLAGEQGLTKGEINLYHKERYLLPIYEADPKQQDLAEMMESIREVWRNGDHAKAIQLKDFVVKHITSAVATVTQFSEYLNDIERGAISEGISLPHPEDIYGEAMGC